MKNCQVTLIRPRHAANIGSVARVMCNMGVSQLALVDPQTDHLSSNARQLATHGEHLLDQAQTFPTMSEALADCHLVAATSAHRGGLFRRQSSGTPERILPRFAEAMSTQKIALVFGPEDHGLSDEEVTRCHFLMCVPTDEQCPVLNLAQAVAICLYELRRCWLNDSGEAGEIAPFAEQERAFEQLREALEAIHFLYGEKADALMHGIRHLLSRAQPTSMELGLIFGLARQIRWTVENRED